jgi:hypothetical protein
MGDLAEKAVGPHQAVVERTASCLAVIFATSIDDRKQLDRLCLESSCATSRQPASPVPLRRHQDQSRLDCRRLCEASLEAVRLTKLDTPLPVICSWIVPGVRCSRRHPGSSPDPGLARAPSSRTRLTCCATNSRQLTQAYRDGKLPFEALNPLVMLARRLERVSDQARNISMETLYMCTGEYAKHPGSEVMRVLFVDEHNTCRSLMAEAIGTGLHEPGFVFSSAGVEPLPVYPTTAGFMASKGFDSLGRPKAIPGAEYRSPDVIVLLAEASALPAGHGKRS